MSKNLMINLSFIFANLALLSLLIWPYGLAALEAPAPAAEPLPRRDTVPVFIDYVLTAPAGPEGGAMRKRREPPPARVFRKLPTAEKVVALTFDDGPKGTLEKLLAILADKGVPATFFLLGSNALNKPGLVQAIAAAGCEVANHSWAHPKMKGLPAEKVYWQIEACAAAFKAMGVEALPYLRPPYGSWDKGVQEACTRLGYEIVLWDVDTRDWEDSNPTRVLDRAHKGLKPGSIILFHDGPAVTLKVLPQFIDEAVAQGYRFVLLSEYIPEG